MAVNQEVEVVSVMAIDDQLVRVGLVPAGRIAQYSNRADQAQPQHRGTIGAESFVDWPVADAPSIGEVMDVGYSRRTAP
jgi:hypothetical protein